MTRLGRSFWYVFAYVLLILAPRVAPTTAAAQDGGTGGTGATLPPPTDFSGTALSPTSIEWSWTDTLGETEYVLQDGGGGTILTGIPADTTSIIETGLTPATTVTRRIVALSGGLSAASNPDTVTTPGLGLVFVCPGGSFTIPPFDGFTTAEMIGALQDAVQDASAVGCITKPGTANSLLAKLDTALAKSAVPNTYGAAENVLLAFVNQVEAQNGSALDEAFGDALAELVLEEVLPSLQDDDESVEAMKDIFKKIADEAYDKVVDPLPGRLKAPLKTAKGLIDAFITGYKAGKFTKADAYKLIEAFLNLMDGAVKPESLDKLVILTLNFLKCLQDAGLLPGLVGDLAGTSKVVVGLAAQIEKFIEGLTAAEKAALKTRLAKIRADFNALRAADPC